METTLEHSPASGSEKGAEPKLSQEPPPGRSWSSPSGLWQRKTTVIAVLSIVAILLHSVLRFGFHATPGTYQIPLLATLALGGLPLLSDLAGSSNPNLLFRNSGRWRRPWIRKSIPWILTDVF